MTCYVAREHKFTGRLQFASVLLAFNETLSLHGTLKYFNVFPELSRFRNYVKGQSEENIIKALGHAAACSKSAEQLYSGRGGVAESLPASAWRARSSASSCQDPG